MNPLFDDPDPRHALLSYDAELRGRGNPLLAFGRNMGRAVRGMLGAGGDLNPTGGLIEPSVEGLVGAGDFAAEMLNPLPPLDRSIEAFGRGDYADAALEGYTAIPMGGIFAGRGARTANLAALRKAEDMAEAGADRRAIWDETGWFKGRDGRWRFEIDDSGARFRAGDAINDEGHIFYPKSALESYGPMRERFDHQGLFDAYPDLARAETMTKKAGVDRGSRGSYGTMERGDSVQEIFETAANNPQDMRNVLLHEAQHGVQAREGFARGGNADGMRNNNEAVFSRIYSAAGKAANRVSMLGETPQQAANYIARAENMDPQQIRYMIDTYTPDQLSDMAWRTTPQQQYRRLSGEVEARNVQTRMDMTPAERRARPPWETQDVSDELQIVRMGDGGGPQMSVGRANPLLRDLPSTQRGGNVQEMPTRAYHATYEPFDEYDWSRLGSFTHSNAAGSSQERWAMNLAELGPWASDASVARQMAVPHSLPVEITGRPRIFKSLDSLERAIRKAGGPQAFRERMLKDGYGHIRVADEEFGVTSLIGLAPENFRIVKD